MRDDMRKPFFVAFSGRKQTGKDSCATFLTEAIGELAPQLSVERTHFAEPLKRACNIIFGIPMELMFGSDEDKETLTDVMWDGFDETIRLKYATHTKGGQVLSSMNPEVTRDLSVAPRSGAMTIREVLQIMGTDIFREQVENDVWAKAPFRRQWDSDIVLIPDCRFPNEVKHTLLNDGRVFRIERDTGLNDNHASETSLDDFDFARTTGCTLLNGNITLEQLRSLMWDRASRLLEEINV